MMCIFVGGSVLTGAVGFYWAVWYALIGGLLVTFNEVAVKRRLESLEERQEIELATRVSPVEIKEVID